ncbi:MAG: PilZ domain-containing protein [Hyphomicrobiales bacterium]|nr:PilZ domain-containing protein [Hyphomicrobiales bacterium]
MQIARKAERVRSLLSARVVFNDSKSTLDCVIRNISPVGARLEIADSMALPTEFELQIPTKGKSFRAQIVWRSDGLVGVEMIDRTAAAAAGPADETEADRADRLMKENARLKAQILELKQRIAQLNEGY